MIPEVSLIVKPIYHRGPQEALLRLETAAVSNTSGSSCPARSSGTDHDFSLGHRTRRYEVEHEWPNEMDNSIKQIEDNTNMAEDQ